MMRRRGLRRDGWRQRHAAGVRTTGLLGIAGMAWLLLGAAATAGLPGAGSLAAIKARGELVVVTRNAPTTTFIDSAGHTVGFEHDLASAFAQYLGVKPRFVEVDSVQAMLDDVEDGKADLAAGDITRTAARGKRFRFGPTYGHVT